MKYLIDTDIASYYLRGKHNLKSLFEQKGFSNLRLSVVTVAELRVLAYRNSLSKINLSTIDALSHSLGILDLDSSVWHSFSKIKADLLSCGKLCGDIDILQASIAKRHGLVVVTNNTTHFEHIIAVENWTRPTGNSHLPFSK